MCKYYRKIHYLTSEFHVKFHEKIDVQALGFLNTEMVQMMFVFSSAGRAVFADKTCVKGAFLLQYTGEILSAKEAEEREECDDENPLVFRYFFRFKDHTMW